MSEKLPYELTKGVTATREGLIVDPVEGASDWLTDAIGYDGAWEYYGVTAMRIAWRYVAESLRYREGEPWCIVIGDKTHGIDCFADGFTIPNQNRVQMVLHRLAAILCDDAEAFRVLHWYIHNLGGNS